MPIPARRSSRTRSSAAPVGGLERAEAQDLRADVQMQADDLDPGQLFRARVDLERLVVGDPELVLATTGADLVVGVGGDVGVDPERDRRAAAARGRDLAERDQLRHRFDVELRDPGIERQDHLVAALADAREHDLPGRHAGCQRALQLAARDHLGAGARRGQRPDHGEIAVRLERIAEHHLLPGERLEEAPDPGPHAGRGIDVGGRADRSRDRRQRHRLRAQLAVPIAEVAHGSAFGWVSGWVSGWAGGWTGGCAGGSAGGWAGG